MLMIHFHTVPVYTHEDTATYPDWCGHVYIYIYIHTYTCIRMFILYLHIRTQLCATGVLVQIDGVV